LNIFGSNKSNSFKNTLYYWTF